MNDLYNQSNPIIPLTNSMYLANFDHASVTDQPATLKEASKGLALVVDDSVTNRVILEALLGREGYLVISAEDGLQAVQMYVEHQPDIVFMDVMMPKMDGYEAATRIKALADMRFVPVIFLTALTSDEALAKCIDAGGDDFLSKPYKQSVLRTKVIALERIRNLTRMTELQHRTITEQHMSMLREQEVAEHIYNTAVTSDNVGLDYIRSLLRPVSTFSGDMLLSAYHPAGKLHVLLGDFTGHGLTASIGALPAADVFRTMTVKGYSAPEILAAINQKLHRLLPADMFMAGCLVTVEEDMKTVAIWNAAMPDVLLIDGQTQHIKARVTSVNLPLGIMADTDYRQTVMRFDLTPGDRIVMCSDGVTEARNAAQECFGEQRLMQSIRSGSDSFTSIITALDTFCAGANLLDDLSLVEILCQQNLLENIYLETASQFTQPMVAQDNRGWCWELDLKGSSLRHVNPVPLAISQLLEIEGISEGISAHRQTLFVILTELYSNALEHGVLQMSSRLKSSADGFSLYYAEREAKLARLKDGFIRFKIEHVPLENGQIGHDRLVIRIKDSGVGFNFTHWMDKHPNNAMGLSGRGIMLLQSLCQSVRYAGNGNQVEIIYVLKNDSSSKL
jgi:two-component system, HptB-dependent secretion and biofilm response regulator